jgi:diketogulonate reductase-like aldo/keto reductase
MPSFIYGTAWKEDRTRDLALLALRSGFRAVDTANQRRHYLEAGVGEALEASGVPRSELFLQTKFTYAGGQDHRLPYDPKAGVATQVRQSFASSLEHLRTDYVDSYVLHGPASRWGWSAEDAEAWKAMEELQASGKALQLGVSNVSIRHLRELCATAIPAFVQNRCYARFGWDREVREFCRERGIHYQGFSLLTANPEIVHHPEVAAMAARRKATPCQVIFRFAQQIGMIPLTGTTDAAHMREDLACEEFDLSTDELRAVESISG